jgi:hypothetical protein
MSLLTFKEADGRADWEMLGPAEDFADLVDPGDGSVRHSEPFAMNGREWTVASVTVTDDLIRIECVPTGPESARDRTATGPSTSRTPSSIDVTEAP